MMNEAHEKAKSTRQRNAEARARLWEEQREATKTAKKALLRVMESEGSTPEQILRAAELLAQIGKW